MDAARNGQVGAEAGQRELALSAQNDPSQRHKSREEAPSRWRFGRPPISLLIR